jgi:non-homologous end joining protein Ku
MGILMAESVRAFWKGSLRLSLVFIPVKLVSAVRTEGEVHLHQVDRKTQQRIRYQKVNSAGKFQAIRWTAVTFFSNGTNSTL